MMFKTISKSADFFHMLQHNEYKRFLCLLAETNEEISLYIRKLFGSDSLNSKFIFDINYLNSDLLNSFLDASNLGHLTFENTNDCIYFTYFLYTQNKASQVNFISFSGNVDVVPLNLVYFFPNLKEIDVSSLEDYSFYFDKNYAENCLESLVDPLQKELVTIRINLNGTSFITDLSHDSYFNFYYKFETDNITLKCSREVEELNEIVYSPSKIKPASSNNSHKGVLDRFFSYLKVSESYV